MNIRTLSQYIGSEIEGIDVTSMDDALLDRAKKILADRGVLFFKDQDLTPRSQLEFAERWGQVNVNRFFTPVEEEPRVAEVLKENIASFKARMNDGDEVKVKKSNVRIQMISYDSEHFIKNAQSLGKTIKVENLWCLFGVQELSFDEIAKKYFQSDNLTPLQLGGVLFCLNSHPVYFYRRGEGCYKAASPEVLEQALIALKTSEKNQKIIKDSEK